MITFLGLESRTSGRSRGLQFLPWIKGAQFIDIRRYKRRMRNRVTIAIRHYKPEVFQWLKRRGHVVGYDLLDTPAIDREAADANGEEFCWSRYASPDIDFYLVNNTLCRDELHPHVNGRSIHVVPHATVNWERHRNLFNVQVRVIGYVGLAEQNRLSGCIVELCKARGIRFVNEHALTREECVGLFSQFDIGVVPMWDSHSLNYKGNTKISNLQSFGIPTVASRYRSFEEFGDNAWIPVDGPDDFLPALEALIDDIPRRRQIADDAFRVGEKFHVVRVAETYTQIALNESAHAPRPPWWRRLLIR